MRNVQNCPASYENASRNPGGTSKTNDLVSWVSSTTRRTRSGWKPWSLLMGSFGRLVDDATLHHEVHVLGDRDVLGRVARHRDHVGEVTRREAPERVLRL